LDAADQKLLEDDSASPQENDQKFYDEEDDLKFDGMDEKDIDAQLAALTKKFGLLNEQAGSMGGQKLVDLEGEAVKVDPSPADIKAASMGGEDFLTNMSAVYNMLTGASEEEKKPIGAIQGAAFF
jgi:hypothetical protein